MSENRLRGRYCLVSIQLTVNQFLDNYQIFVIAIPAVGKGQ